MKFLGLDYGAKRIGLALSDAEGTIAFPRETIENDSRARDRILDTIQEEKVGHIVFGDTRSFGGAENPVTAEAELFADELARESGVPLSRAFEVFSSIEVSQFAPKGKEHDDSAAAAFILQRFLDMKQ